MAKLLVDTNWLDTVYFPANITRYQKNCLDSLEYQTNTNSMSRLASSFVYTEKRLSSLGIPVIRAQAGLFCWADFRYIDYVILLIHGENRQDPPC